jgi:hypothetical protein
MVWLRRIGPKDTRAMIIKHQGWDPGDLNPERIRPLSEKSKATLRRMGVRSVQLEQKKKEDEDG